MNDQNFRYIITKAFENTTKSDFHKNTISQNFCLKI